MPQLYVFGTIDELRIESTGDPDPKPPPTGPSLLSVVFHVSMIRLAGVGRHPPQGRPPRVDSAVAASSYRSRVLAASIAAARDETPSFR